MEELISQEVLLEPTTPKNAPSCLGGYSPENVAKLPFYASLDRSKPLSSWKDKHVLSEIDPTLEELVDSLFDKGTMWVHWAIQQPRMFAMKVFDARSTAKERAEEENMLLMFRCDFDGVNLRLSPMFLAPIMVKYFPVNDQEAVCMRVLHLFLRQHAQQLGNFMLLHGCFGHLGGFYERSRQFKNKLELSLLRVDTFVSFKGLLLPTKKVYDAYVNQALNDVGESLESLGRFHEAANLYEEVAHNFKSVYDLNERYILYMNSGVAYRRAGEFELTEKAYISSLWWGLQNENTWGIDGCGLALGNLLTLYEYWVPTKPSMGRYATIMACLVITAGFETPKTQLHRMQAARTIPHMAEQVRSKQGAKQHLIAAIQASRGKDCITFQNVLSECLPAGTPFSFFSRVLSQKEDKKHARQRTAENSREKVFFSKKKQDCCNLGCPNREKQATQEEGRIGLLRCSKCKKVWYCSRECQVEHWRSGHKQECKKPE